MPSYILCTKSFEGRSLGDSKTHPEAAYSCDQDAKKELGDQARGLLVGQVTRVDYVIKSGGRMVHLMTVTSPDRQELGWGEIG